VELERERGLRAQAEEELGVAKAELVAANAKVADVVQREADEVAMREELERTRLALRSARTNAAMHIMDAKPAAGPARTPTGRNPIGMPRSQFGGTAASLRASTHATSGVPPSDPRLERLSASDRLIRVSSSATPGRKGALSFGVTPSRATPTTSK
jgi:hypothetical protein